MKFKSVQRIVDAIQLTCPIAMEGETYNEGSWLVSESGYQYILSDEDFKKQFIVSETFSEPKEYRVSTMMPKRNYSADDVLEKAVRRMEGKKLSINSALEKLKNEQDVSDYQKALLEQALTDLRKQLLQE